jgi:dephospho-CoA kinase
MPIPSTGSSPLRIVVMGGIGAGKSTVTGRFAALGATVIEADRLGHDVLEPGGAAFEPVAARWPETVVDGRVDRAALAEIVFRDNDELRALEAITHPAIATEIARRADAAGQSPVVVELPVEAALVGDEWIRVAVIAPWEIRLSRAVRRGFDAADVERRAAAQPSAARWRDLANRVIVNDGGLDALYAQVDALWEELVGD